MRCFLRTFLVQLHVCKSRKRKSIQIKCEFFVKTLEKWNKYDYHKIMKGIAILSRSDFGNEEGGSIEIISSCLSWWNYFRLNESAY